MCPPSHGEWRKPLSGWLARKRMAAAGHTCHDTKRDFPPGKWYRQRQLGNPSSCHTASHWFINWEPAQHNTICDQIPVSRIIVDNYAKHDSLPVTTRFGSVVAADNASTSVIEMPRPLQSVSRLYSHFSTILNVFLQYNEACLQQATHEHSNLTVNSLAAAIMLSRSKYIADFWRVSHTFFSIYGYCSCHTAFKLHFLARNYAAVEL